MERTAEFCVLVTHISIDFAFFVWSVLGGIILIVCEQQRSNNLGPGHTLHGKFIILTKIYKD